MIAGIKAMFEREGLYVYVDWLDDPQLDRSHATERTADALRSRMPRSRFLLYASSSASSRSRWVPWELGYFDGYRPGRVGILPIVATAGAGFQGQEYLGLHPLVQQIDFTGYERHFGWMTGPREGKRSATMARA